MHGRSSDQIENDGETNNVQRKGKSNKKKQKKKSYSRRNQPITNIFDDVAREIQINLALQPLNRSFLNDNYSNSSNLNDYNLNSGNLNNFILHSRNPGNESLYSRNSTANLHNLTKSNENNKPLPSSLSKFDDIQSNSNSASQSSINRQSPAIINSFNSSLPSCTQTTIEKTFQINSLNIQNSRNQYQHLSQQKPIENECKTTFKHSDLDNFNNFEQLDPSSLNVYLNNNSNTNSCSDRNLSLENIRNISNKNENFHHNSNRPYTCIGPRQRPLSSILNKSSNLDFNRPQSTYHPRETDSKPTNVIKKWPTSGMLHQPPTGPDCLPGCGYSGLPCYMCSTKLIKEPPAEVHRSTANIINFTPLRPMRRLSSNNNNDNDRSRNQRNRRNNQRSPKYCRTVIKGYKSLMKRIGVARFRAIVLITILYIMLIIHIKTNTKD